MRLAEAEIRKAENGNQPQLKIGKAERGNVPPKEAQNAK